MAAGILELPSFPQSASTSSRLLIKVSFMESVALQAGVRDECVAAVCSPEVSTEKGEHTIDRAQLAKKFFIDTAVILNIGNDENENLLQD